MISSLAQIRILKLREAGRPAPVTPLLGVTSESGRAGSHPSCVTPPSHLKKKPGNRTGVGRRVHELR